MIRWNQLKRMAYNNQPVDKSCGIEKYTHYLIRDIYTKYRNNLMAEDMCKAYVAHIEKEYRWYYAHSIKKTAFYQRSIRNIALTHNIKERLFKALINNEELTKELFVDALELITILSRGEDVTLKLVKKHIKEMEEEENGKKA